jgi:hypothetical protein
MKANEWTVYLSFRKDHRRMLLGIGIIFAEKGNGKDEDAYLLNKAIQ